MGKILYVGGFILPDKNAAAQRVVSLAKGMRALGNEVVFTNYSGNIRCNRLTEYFGFQCYEYPKRNILQHLSDISDIRKLVNELQITHVVAYNYPAVALWKLIRFCKHKGVVVIADSTEWYQAEGNLLYRFVKTIDTEWRMRLLHKKVNAVIAISDYLFRYYSPVVKTIKIPAIVDIAEDKWDMNIQKNCDIITFVYAGSPSAQKEKIDSVVNVIENVSHKKLVKLKIIGITQEQYEKMYNTEYNGVAVTFLGRIPHKRAIEEIQAANWAIVIRENNKVVQAGFPTKVVESVSCGTPVLANRFSNIFDYLDEKDSYLCEIDQIEEAICAVCDVICHVDRTKFDYHNYLHEISIALS